MITRSMARLRHGFNVLAPNRDTASDGGLGDKAHQQRKSGHNLDESGNAERRDADTKDEYRAIDVDKDLREPGITMQDCVNEILDTPADRRRLIYIIFDGYIWEASNGWRKRRYTGDNPHDKHAHFSGHPDYDEDGAAWCLERMDDMAYTEQELRGLALQGSYDLWQQAALRNTPTGRQFAGFVAKVFGGLDDEIVAGVLAGLGTKALPEVAAALRAVFGAETAELAELLARAE